MSDEELKNQLFTKNRLMKLDGKAAIYAKNDCPGDCPDWFAPKAADKYEVWIFEDQIERKFRVLIDKETGNLFITDYQY
jgi:hypothetical protein